MKKLTYERVNRTSEKDMLFYFTFWRDDEFDYFQWIYNPYRRSELYNNPDFQLLLYKEKTSFFYLLNKDIFPTCYFTKDKI